MNSPQTSHPTEPIQHRRLSRALHRTLDTLGWVMATGLLLFLLPTACILPLGGDLCSSNAECPSDRPFCIGAKCAECFNDSHCEAGETCFFNICQPLPCADSSAPQCAGECPAGQECSDQSGTCACVPEAECTTGGNSLLGAAVNASLASESLSAPSAQSDCPPGDTCVANQCETLCATDADCPAFMNRCANGQCTQCISDADCQFGACIGGQCGNCASDADCSPPVPYCSFLAPVCVQCLMDSHCQEGQQCDNSGFCFYRFAENPDVSVTLSDNRSGATPEMSVNFSFAKDELQLWRVQFSSSSPFSGFRGFDVLGPANTVVGRGALDHNDDGVADATVDIRSIDQNNAYADMNGNGVADSGEPTIAKTSFPPQFVETLPFGDGDPSTLIHPFGGRMTITLFSGIFTLDACPGRSPIDVTLISVDQGSGDANDNLYPPPLFRTVRVEIEITTPATCGDGDVDFCEQCDGGGETPTCDTNCTPAFCGDRTVNQTAGEQCDEGLRCDDGVTPCERTSQCPRLSDGTRSCLPRNVNGCTETCQLDPNAAVCGNGTVESGETCDDGNTTAGDGCSAACTVEPGWTCTITIGQPSVCTPTCTPAPEICNGLDDDCDGAMDEGNPGGGELCFTGLRGLCSGGIENCIGGRIECQPVHQPSAEACDGLDNDCDGPIDNVLGFGLPCTAGVGDCQRSGEFVCKEGSLQLQCSATPGEPGTEICGNDIDEDCDGADLPCPVTPINEVNGALNLDSDPNQDKVAVQAIVPLPGATAQTVSPAPGIPFDPLTEGVTLRLEQAGNVVVNVQFPPGEGWKVNKKGNTWSFKDKKDGSLGDPSKDTVSMQCNTKKQTCSIQVNVKETELGEVSAGEITTTVIIGDDRFQNIQPWREKAKGKKLKLVTP